MVVLAELDEDVPVRLLVLDVGGLGAEVQAVDGRVGVAGEEQLLVLGVIGQAFRRTHIWWREEEKKRTNDDDGSGQDQQQRSWQWSVQFIPLVLLQTSAFEVTAEASAKFMSGEEEGWQRRWLSKLLSHMP